jgi:ubiquinone/menaquinone biosynthesis C-methylase UbiE
MIKDSLSITSQAAFKLDASNTDIDKFFRSELFVSSTVEEQRAFLYKSAKSRYDYELENHTLERVFQTSLEPYLSDKVVLDFGCFTGGTSVAWQEKYNFKKIYGFDVDEIYARAAKIFSEEKGVEGEFIHAYGEDLPYANESMDTIISLDVFEHVRDVSVCMNECYRMLKKGGHLILVFPPFYHPLEHHLKTSSTPCLHWFFSKDTLKEVTNIIVKEKGEEYYHYLVGDVPDYYKIMSLNGITVGKFKRILQERDWEVVLKKQHGVPFFGRKVAKSPTLQAISKINGLISNVPILEEILLDRIAMIIKKR